MIITRAPKHERMPLMDLQFSDERSDYPLFEGQPDMHEASEATVDAAPLTGISGSGDTAPSSRQGGLARAPWRAVTHAVVSQEYIGVLVATMVLVLVIGAVRPDFLNISNLLDILSQATTVALLACGMAFLLSMRELDLSVGAIYGLTALCAAILMHDGVPSWLGVIVGILLGTALGLTNGLLIQFFRLPSIVATLATMSIFRGLIFGLSKGLQVIALPLNDPFAEVMGAQPLGIPMDVWVMVAVMAILVLVLHMTPFGYRVRSIGSNPDAAVFSGLPVKRVRLLAFALMGTLGGLVGMLTLGYLGSSDPNLGVGYELLAIAAAVIGGTPLRGGKATIVGAALGAILLSVVSAGLIYFNIEINWTAFYTGIVILLAVALDGLLRSGRFRRKPRL